jgi:DNA-binding MarR family transcriptional regulator
VTHLAKVEGVRPQSMGATVAGLEAAGLIVGTPDPADGRRTILDLTEACRDLVRKGRAAREDWLSQALSRHFTVAEQGDIARGIELLKRLADS